jgi:hypothetical protein
MPPKELSTCRSPATSFALAGKARATTRAHLDHTGVCNHAVVLKEDQSVQLYARAPSHLCVAVARVQVACAVVQRVFVPHRVRQRRNANGGSQQPVHHHIRIPAGVVTLWHVQSKFASSAGDARKALLQNNIESCMLVLPVSNALIAAV